MHVWKVCRGQLSYHHIIIGFLINVPVQKQHPHQWAPFQIAGLLHTWQISHQISTYFHHGLIAESFHYLQSLSVSCFHVNLGLQGPRFPSTCMSKAVLTAPLEHSTCPYQWSLLSFRMRSRSSMPSCASSSLDLVVTVLQPDTADLFDHCPVIPLQTFEVWFCQRPNLSGVEHCPQHTRAVHMATCFEREVAWRENW